MKRIILFGDIPGIPQLLRHLPPTSVVGIVGASIRPQYLCELNGLANDLNVQFLIQPKWQSDEYQSFIDAVKSLSPDLILINSYSMIIRGDLLQIPSFGGLNIHAALLPRNRGCNPTQWAILKGELKTGVTLHVIDTGIDTGPIIDQCTVPIFFDDTWLDVRARLEKSTDNLIRSNLNDILSGNWVATPQNESDATVGRRRSPLDSILSWEAPLVDIHNLVRALVPPLPPARYQDLDGNWIEISDYQTIWQLAIHKFNPSVGGQRLQAEGIKLRPLLKCDAQLFSDLIINSEPLISNYPFYPILENNFECWFNRAISNRSDVVIFVIEELQSKRAIGICQLLNINWIHRSAELQIRFGNEEYLGRAYGSQSVRMLCHFGFHDLNLHRIYLHVFCTNHRAIRAYEKCGFKKEGILREAAFIDGKWLDVLIMGLLKTDG
jgi:methionyl-tRNA formyltransferase